MRPPLVRTTPLIVEVPHELQGDADAFTQTALEHPEAMVQAFDTIKVSETLDCDYLPGEEVDPDIERCAHAILDLMNKGVDRFFKYDSSTEYAFRTNGRLRKLWTEKRDATDVNEVIAGRQIRLERLAIFTGRLADPFGIKQMSRAV